MTQSLFIRRYSNRFLSRWLVLAIDLLIVMFSFSLSSLLRMYSYLSFDYLCFCGINLTQELFDIRV